jgi:hypothetical protein
MDNIIKIRYKVDIVSYLLFFLTFLTFLAFLAFILFTSLLLFNLVSYQCLYLARLNILCIYFYYYRFISFFYSIFLVLFCSCGYKGWIG